MEQILLLGLLGLGIGGFYGLLAIGVVVGHKGSGLINLDQGALAMFPAYAFITMRESGDVYLPWFDIIPGPLDLPERISLADSGVGAPAALAVGIAMSVVLGLIMQNLVFGPLRDRPTISKVIGSLGALLYLTSLSLHHFGARARNVDGILPDGAWEQPFGMNGQIPYERLALAALAIIVGAALTQYYRWTRTGLATQAVEESEFGAALLGYSVQRIATVNWLISTTLTGVAGILALDFVSLTPTRYTLFVIPALGAALFGNLTSSWMAGLGGVLLGSFQSAAAGLTLEEWWPTGLPQEGVRQAVPLLVIVAFQFTRGNTIPVRSTRFFDRQPTTVMTRRVWPGLLVVSAAAIVLLATGSRVTEAKLVATLIAAILMLSSVVLTGYLGQISLANVAFAGVTAYLATKFASDGSQFGFSPFVTEGPGLPAPIALFLGVAISVVAGVVIAVPAVRIRGIQLAVVTLAAAVAATALVLGNEWLMGPGARSNVTVPPPKWFGVEVGVATDASGLNDRRPLALFTLAWLILTVLAVTGLRRGITGRRFLAVRANERAAAAAGINVAGTKLLGFGISSAIAGIAGGLTAYQQGVLQITTWGALAGIGNLALLFLGGVGRLSGVVFGALLTPGGLTSSTSSEGALLRDAVAGLAMIAVAIFQPDGLTSLIPAPKRAWQWVRDRLAAYDPGSEFEARALRAESRAQRRR